MAHKKQTVGCQESLNSLHHAIARFCSEIDQQVPAEDDVIRMSASEDTLVHVVAVNEMHPVPYCVLQDVLATSGHKIALTKRLGDAAKRVPGISCAFCLLEQRRSTPWDGAC